MPQCRPPGAPHGRGPGADRADRRRLHPAGRPGRFRSGRAWCTTVRRRRRSRRRARRAGRAGHPRISGRPGPAGAGASDRAQAADRERHRRRATAAAIMVTAGANMAFMHARARDHRAGRRNHPAVPFYFNHEMAIQMAGCRAVRVPTDERYQLRHRRHSRAPSPIGRAPSSPSRRTTRAARCFSEAIAPRGQRPVPRARALSHRRRGRTSTSPTGLRVTSRPARSPARRATPFRMYSLSKAYGFAGWRIGYMVYPEQLASR